MAVAVQIGRFEYFKGRLDEFSGFGGPNFDVETELTGQQFGSIVGLLNVTMHDRVSRFPRSICDLHQVGINVAELWCIQEGVELECPFRDLGEQATEEPFQKGSRAYNC